MVDSNQQAEDSTADEDSREDNGSNAGPARRGGAGGNKVKAAAGCTRCSGRVLAAAAAALVDVDVDERRYYHSSMIHVVCDHLSIHCYLGLVAHSCSRFWDVLVVFLSPGILFPNKVETTNHQH